MNIEEAKKEIYKNRHSGTEWIHLLTLFGTLEKIYDDFESRTCEWVEDEAEYEKRYYFSKCGFDFIFIDERDNLTDFGFKFCPKCGAKIIEAKDNKHKEDN